MKRLIALVMIAFCLLYVNAQQIYFLPNTDTNRGMSYGTSRSSVPAHLNALINTVKGIDKDIESNVGDISSVINKSWYLNAEFEKDRNIMLQLFRELLDQEGSIEDSMQSMELELFNPDSLPFKEFYNTVAMLKKSTDASYKAMESGKSGLRDSKKMFGEVLELYPEMSKLVNVICDTVSGAVPYTPEVVEEPVVNEAPAEPEPEYDFNSMKVNVVRKRIKVSKYDIINVKNIEGRMVIKKSKERLHELSTVDRFLYKEALKEKEGYTYVIAKNAKNDYTVYWWHVADEIAGVIDTIGNIFD